MNNNCHCGEEPLTREGALDQASDLIDRAAEHVDAGRISEAQMLNALAQTSLALAERVMPSVATGPVH